jgi:hypothetical protein
MPLLEHFPAGLTTAEVAALLADGPDPIADSDGAERALLELVAEGFATREPLGQDAVWRSASGVPAEASAETSVAVA